MTRKQHQHTVFALPPERLRVHCAPYHPASCCRNNTTRRQHHAYQRCSTAPKRRTSSLNAKPPAPHTPPKRHAQHRQITTCRTHNAETMCCLPAARPTFVRGAETPRPKARRLDDEGASRCRNNDPANSALAMSGCQPRRNAEDIKRKTSPASCR
jgi:hypothetical protein